jgi:hypothetical protein
MNAARDKGRAGPSHFSVRIVDIGPKAVEDA